MTEEQIERHVEQMTNRVDMLYMSQPEMTEIEYKMRLIAIDVWAEYQYGLISN